MARTHPHAVRSAFSYVATCQPVLGWGAGIVSGSGQSAIGARNLDGHAAHEIVYEAAAAYSRSGSRWGVEPVGHNAVD
ncbi:MAG: hypothetical protein ACYC26_17600, partial [Phycisphaerales bacterium]